MDAVPTSLARFHDAIFSRSATDSPCLWLRLRGGVDETEDVVKDVVAAVGGQKLESLSVAHGPALLLDLHDVLSVSRL